MDTTQQHMSPTQQQQQSLLQHRQQQQNQQNQQNLQQASPHLPSPLLQQQSQSPPPQPPSIRRKMSIAERATAVIESRLSASTAALRRTSTRDSSPSISSSSNNNIIAAIGLGTGGSSLSISSLHSSNGRGSSNNNNNDDQCAYSMNPEDYELGQVIGQGSSASVYIAKYKPLNRAVSMKVIDLDLFERNQIDELRREIQIMSLSKHANLLPVYGSFVNGSKLFIVTPFLAGGSCLDIMKTSFKEGFDEVSIATILKQTLQGLDYLHKNGLIHRDVKAGNLLIDKDGLVQLADFGVSSSLMDSGDRRGLRKTFVGTPCWMAPEVMEQSGYDYKADIWSFGITALELANAQAPYAKFPPLKVLMLTLQNEPPTLDRDSTKVRSSRMFKDMIDMCLKKDPTHRPTTERLLQHSFFKSAKKNFYLVSSILSHMVPITERQHLHTVKVIQQENSSEYNPLAGRAKGVSFREIPSEVIEAGPRKSRFIVDLPDQSSFGSTANDGPSSPMVPELTIPPLDQLQVPSNQAPSLSPLSQTSSQLAGSSASGTLAAEIKKGRFSVMETGVTGSSNSLTSPEILNPGPTSAGSTSDLRVPMLERKPSRFAVQPSISPASASSQQISIPQELERSASSDGTQEGGNLVRKPTGGPTYYVNGQLGTRMNGPASTFSAPLSSNSSSSLSGGIVNTINDKRGRFQISSSTDTPNNSNTLSGASQNLGSLSANALLSHSVRSSLLPTALAPIPLEGSPVERLEMLTKISEAQRKVIHDAMAILTRHGLNPYQPLVSKSPSHSLHGHHSRSASYSDADRGVMLDLIDIESSPPIPVAGELESQLAAALSELETLRIENERLRKATNVLHPSPSPPPS
ncbi:hypothetical protein BASA62_001195 [Batrachochytrium salamandrivorans]|nr:hypothetical protein BASA62_001195 [Batrachochytrium salamandrivorans]